MTNHRPSVLWHFWLGHQTCKNRRPYNLFCVVADVKPCTTNQRTTYMWRYSGSPRFENRVYDENIKWQNYKTVNRFIPSPLFSLSLHSSLFLFVSVCINMFLFLFYPLSLLIYCLNCYACTFVTCFLQEMIIVIKDENPLRQQSLL